jgi:hypothetical protein
MFFKAVMKRFSFAFSSDNPLEN